MFSRNLTKTLLSATAFSLLTACAIVDKKDSAEESNWFVQMFEKDGQNYADKATITYSAGQFDKTLEYTTEALKANPRNQQALLVGALAAEKLGRYNKARQYYEDLIIINGQELSILGSSDGQPQKISEIAKNNLRAITIAQSNLTIENRDGTKHFAISEDAGELQSKTTIATALNKKNIKAVRSQPIGVDDIFSPQEQNIVSRFLILKELAEMSSVGLGPEWSWIRNPEAGRYALTGNALRLYGTASGLNETVASPTFVGVRQIDVDFSAETCITLGSTWGLPRWGK